MKVSRRRLQKKVPPIKPLYRHMNNFAVSFDLSPAKLKRDHIKKTSTRTDGFLTEDDTHMNSQFDGKKPCKEKSGSKRQMVIYHCDSIAIRPTTTLPDLLQTQRSKVVVSDRKSELSPADEQCRIGQKNRLQQCEQKTINITELQLEHTEKKKVVAKARKKIFSCLKKSIALEHLEVNRLRSSKRHQGNEVHITFENDQITSCCL